MTNHFQITQLYHLVFSKHLSSIYEKAAYRAGSALPQESPKLDDSNKPQKDRTITYHDYYYFCSVFLCFDFLSFLGLLCTHVPPRLR